LTWRVLCVLVAQCFTNLETNQYVSGNFPSICNASIDSWIRLGTSISFLALSAISVALFYVFCKMDRNILT
jgi:hypothetical protein